MSTLIHADVFFFVTTVAVILVALLFAVVIIYVVRILNDVRYISRLARQQSDLLSEDLAELRTKLKRDGIVNPFFSFIAGLFQARGKRSKRK